METDEPVDIERELAQAHLLIMRGSYTEARRLLTSLTHAGVSDDETEPLLEQIRVRQVEVRQTAEARRDWRYYLGLQTSAARFGWFAGALAAAVYGAWHGIDAVEAGCKSGFTTRITTMVSTRTGMVPWTRPIYEDVIESALLLVGGIAVMAVVAWARKDAAQWEELDALNSSRNGL